MFTIWSEKNEKTPYNYYSTSANYAWWKCEKGLHPDFRRKIINSFTQNYQCPICVREKQYQRAKENAYDITGQQFGELIVLYRDTKKSEEKDTAWWVCQCSCGAIKSIRCGDLKNGHTTTCGNYSIHFIGENSPSWKGGLTSKTQLGKNNSAYTK